MNKNYIIVKTIENIVNTSFVVILLVFSSCQNSKTEYAKNERIVLQSRIENYIIESKEYFHSDSGLVIDFKNITDFKWEYMYIVNPYMENNILAEEFSKLKWKIKKTDYLIRSNAIRFIFIQSDSIVQYVEIDLEFINKVHFTNCCELDYNKVTRENSRFIIACGTIDMHCRSIHLHPLSGCIYNDGNCFGNTLIPVYDSIDIGTSAAVPL